MHHFQRTTISRTRIDVFRLITGILAVGFSVGCMSPPAPPPQDNDSQAYVVGPPDQIEINILPDPAIERTVTVRPDGMVSIELIGDVVAAGRTTDEIAAEIESRISRYKRDARVSVNLSSAQSTTVVIFGEVVSPGVFPLTRDIRIAEAIGLQGGPTIFAATGGLRVIRTNGRATEVIPVDLAAIQDGDLRTNILLKQGDIVVVPPNAFAKVGFVLQTIFFPFQQVFSPIAAGAGTVAIAGGGGFR